MNPILIFLTGLTSGGVSCAAVQGGLVTSLMITRSTTPSGAKSVASKVVLPAWAIMALFLGSKLLVHTVLGALLGYLGSLVTLSESLRLTFQVITALFLLATAGQLLQLHPIFRFVLLQPPRSLTRLVSRSSRMEHWLAPVLLGGLTIFIPCGVTQAMELLAISTGSAWQGALIMFAFVLGTTPIFSLIGLLAAKLTGHFQQRFTKLAALALVIMAISSLNGVLVVLNSPVTLQKITAPLTWFFSEERFTAKTSPPIANGVQQITINVLNQGYSPKYLRVKQGQPVMLTLRSNQTYSCALDFVFKEFNIRTMLAATDEQKFEFTPSRTGRFTFSCGMGMYTGTLEVV